MKANIYLAIHLISVSVDTFVRSQSVTDLINTVLKKSVKFKKSQTTCENASIYNFTSF